MTIEERIELLEFKQQLLFENTEYSRLLFEYNITREQNQAINNLFQDYRTRLEIGKTINSGLYEQEIYRIIPQQYGNYQFAESVAQLSHAEGRWEEIFEALYSDSPKFLNYLSNRL